MERKMLIETIPVGPLQVNCYLLICDKSRQAVVVDPGDEGARILDALSASGCQLAAVINTHGHFDHIGANAYVIEKTGVSLMMHGDDLPLLKQAAEHASIYGLSVVPSPEPTRLLVDGDEIKIGESTLKVIHLPGHSPGGICLHVGNDLIVGDGLFAGSIGRTDLPGGSQELLVSGIRQKLLVLPETTVVHPGHGPATTIGREKIHNPFL
jgi:glyoxylase-like metal-dependent hydrolase (beta-lactamase superfamily II)